MPEKPQASHQDSRTHYRRRKKALKKNKILMGRKKLTPLERTYSARKRVRRTSCKALAEHRGAASQNQEAPITVRESSSLLYFLITLTAGANLLIILKQTKRILSLIPLLGMGKLSKNSEALSSEVLRNFIGNSSPSGSSIVSATVLNCSKIHGHCSW